jgi:hypothetical protein
LCKKEGYLWKKSGRPFRGWRSKYVVLEDMKLKYFKTEDKLQGCLDFNISTCQLEVENAKAPQIFKYL